MSQIVSLSFCWLSVKKLFWLTVKDIKFNHSSKVHALFPSESLAEDSEGVEFFLVLRVPYKETLREDAFLYVLH